MSDVSTNAWLLGNVDQMGYYRVNYDAENWDKLIQQLSDEHEVSSQQMIVLFYNTQRIN